MPGKKTRKENRKEAFLVFTEALEGRGAAQPAGTQEDWQALVTVWADLRHLRAEAELSSLLT